MQSLVHARLLKKTKNNVLGEISKTFSEATRFNRIETPLTGLRCTRRGYIRRAGVVCLFSFYLSGINQTAWGKKYQYGL